MLKRFPSVDLFNARAAAAVADMRSTARGGSYAPRNLQPLKVDAGYRVSVASRTFNVASIEASDVIAAAVAFAAAVDSTRDNGTRLASPVCIGLYRFQDDRRCSVDCNVILPIRAAALEAAAALRQESVYDAAAGVCIPTFGNGATPQMHDSLRILQAILQRY